MTRLWPQGTKIEVRCDDHAQPLSLQWQEQRHRVVTLLHHWRVDIDWWRNRVWRDYYKLITSTGLLVVIYRDVDADQWYLQRLYD